MTDDLLRFLRQNPGLIYCAQCLAGGARVSLNELGDAWAGPVTHRAVKITEGPCVECMQVRTVACVRTGD